jgi:hypothetical protein
MMRFAAAFLGFASWGLATLFSVLYPLPDSLGAARLPEVWSWAWVIPLAASLGYAAWLKPARAKRGLFLGLLGISLVFQLLLASLAAVMIHRDFSSLLFQAVAIHFGLFIAELPSANTRFFTRAVDRIFFFTLAIVAFFLVWIAFMGYAIASRAEPRWIPSIAYNVLNLLICVFIALADFKIHDLMKRRLVVGPDSLLLEEIDVLSLFSPSVRPLALCFLSLPLGESLVCSKAQSLLEGKDCEKDCVKATVCPGYRYLYNRVHEIRKVFTALKIGTIASPENKQTILEQGWSFIPDPSVRIVRMAGEGKPQAALSEASSFSLES